MLGIEEAIEDRTREGDGDVDRVGRGSERALLKRSDSSRCWTQCSSGHSEDKEEADEDIQQKNETADSKAGENSGNIWCDLNGRLGGDGDDCPLPYDASHVGGSVLSTLLLAAHYTGPGVTARRRSVSVAECPTAWGWRGMLAGSSMFRGSDVGVGGGCGEKRKVDVATEETKSTTKELFRLLGIEEAI